MKDLELREARAVRGAAAAGGPGGRKSITTAIWPAGAAYVSALVLVLCGSEAVMLGVGTGRAGGRPERVLSEALTFTMSAQGVMVSALVSALVFAAVALTAARLETREVVTRLGLRPSRASLLGLASAAIGMTGLSCASGAATGLARLPHQGTMDIVAHALERPGPATFALSLATLAVGPGIAEEMLFRGFIQGRLSASWRPLPSIAVTAVGFGLIHLDAVQGLVAALAGLYLGFVTHRFGGIRPAIAAHAVNNAAFVTAASIGSVAPAPPWVDAIVLGAGAVVCAAAWAVLRSPVALRT